MTDGGIYVSEKSETKRFHVQDGLALRCCQMVGLQVAWVSARPSPVTKKRAKELRIDFLVQTPDGKVAAVEKILRKLKLDWDQAAFIGDDILDLAVMAKVGLAAAPANACSEAKALAHLVTRHEGGNGAVRELVEKILKAQGKWEKLVEEIAR